MPGAGHRPLGLSPYLNNPFLQLIVYDRTFKKIADSVLAYFSRGCYVFAGGTSGAKSNES